jgi:RHS repeat-associated protein
MRRGAADFWYHADDLGSVRALTDGAGLAVERYEYGDFGQPKILDGSGREIGRSTVGNPYLFTGQRYDPETGLYAFRTRYLDPAPGRFTSRDTIGMWGDGTNLGNGLAYVGNNPHTFVDPTGRDRTDTFICPTGQWISYETDCGWASSNCPLVVGPGSDTSVTKCMIGSVVCTGTKAASDAYYEVKHARDNAFNGAGYSWPVPQTTLSLNLWFDNTISFNMALSASQAMDINETLGDVYNDEGFTDDDLEIYCSYASENDSDCQGNNAYTDWEGDITFCDPGFWNFPTIARRSVVLLHEMTHAYGQTDDNFYYKPDFAWKNGWSFSKATRIENADTYEQFYLRFAGVQKPCPGVGLLSGLCNLFF